MPAPDDKRRRQQRTLNLVCGALALGALLILLLPGNIPLPLRLGLASVDLVAAATVWLVGRQHLAGK